MKATSKVIRLVGTAALAACVLLLFAACGGGGGGSKAPAAYDGLLVAVASGTSVIMYGVDDAGNIGELDRAELPAAGLLSDHAIFGMTKHPTEPWVYAGSLNECSNGANSCWGNGRVDRFSYDAQGNITHQGLAFNYDTGSGPACAEVNSGYAGQIGECAPTTVALSSDGSRLYVDCDSLDGVQIFEVTASGDLNFLWEGARTSNNGLTVSPDDGYLYNGSSVIELTGDTAARIVDSVEGNATEVVRNTAGDPLLVTTQDNDALAVYDLVDQAAPALVSNLGIADAPLLNNLRPGSARFQASSADLSRFIVVGVESVATVAFDGTTLTLEDQVFDADDTLDVINRCVAITPDGSYALVSWFIPYDAVGDPLLTGGITAYEIAADGTLTDIDTIDFTVPSRGVLGLPTP